MLSMQTVHAINSYSLVLFSCAIQTIRHDLTSYAKKFVEDKSSNDAVSITEYNSIDGCITEHQSIRPVRHDIQKEGRVHFSIIFVIRPSY